MRPQRGLQLIAVFKFLKAAVLVAVGLAALGLLSPSREAQAAEWLDALALNQGHHLVTAWAGRVARLLAKASPQRLVELAVGAFLYASLFLIEGVGLFRAKRWAEYLTTIATCSYLPWEIWALWHHASVPRVVTLILNIAIVVYLITQIRGSRHGAAKA